MNNESRTPEKGYKSFRLTFSNPILVDAVESIQQETQMSESEIAREAILQFLKEEGKITLE